MNLPRRSPILALAVAVYACTCCHAAPVRADTSPPTDPIPAHDSFTLESKAVSETRRINVHTPSGYADVPDSLPVLYMPDGGIEEDFPHVVNSLDSLIALGAARRFIVVGIENTQRRRDMTGPTTVASDRAIAPRVGGSAAFRTFIRDELMPEVRKRYRTTDEAAIVGESLAGLFIVETFLVEPSLFNCYIALSPSLWWNKEELIRTAPQRLDGVSGLHRTLFLSAANEDNIAPQAHALAELLRGQGPPDLTLCYEPRPDLEHGTIYRAMGPRAMRAVLGPR